MTRVPQLLITLSPGGRLLAEVPGHGPARRQIGLGRQTAHAQLLQLFKEQGERAAFEDRVRVRQILTSEPKYTPAREPLKRKQGKFMQIASHPQAIIRERLDPGKARKTLDEMGL